MIYYAFRKVAINYQYLYPSHLFVGINSGMFGSNNIDSMEEEDKEEDDKEHQRQVKEKEEAEKHLLKRVRRSICCARKTSGARKEKSPKANSMGKLRWKSIV
jgi:hypothetical protein